MNHPHHDDEPHWHEEPHPATDLLAGAIIRACTVALICVAVAVVLTGATL